MTGALSTSHSESRAAAGTPAPRLTPAPSTGTTLATGVTGESMIECVRRRARNVKHWQSGEMCLRWRRRDA
jgi:hypothetical protein